MEESRAKTLVELRDLALLHDIKIVPLSTNYEYWKPRKTDFSKTTFRFLKPGESIDYTCVLCDHDEFQKYESRRVKMIDEAGTEL